MIHRISQNIVWVWEYHNAYNMASLQTTVLHQKVILTYQLRFSLVCDEENKKWQNLWCKKRSDINCNEKHGSKFIFPHIPTIQKKEII